VQEFDSNLRKRGMMLTSGRAYGFLKEFLSNPLVAMAFIVIVLFVVMSAAPQLFTPHDPYKMEPVERLNPPGLRNLLGTDEMGRDLYTRIVYGARLTISFSVGVILIALTIGILIGGISGYCGKFIDSVIMRSTDLFLAFPMFVLAMAIVSALGRSLVNAMFALSLVWWAQYARLMRGQVLVAKQELYVHAARATGTKSHVILFRHILPNCFAPLLVKATLDISMAILLLSALSFIGLGAEPPIPEWGAIITTGRRYLIGYWWYPTFPGLAIFLVSMAFNIMGDTLGDLLDPRRIR